MRSVVSMLQMSKGSKMPNILHECSREGKLYKERGENVQDEASFYCLGFGCPARKLGRLYPTSTVVCFISFFLLSTETECINYVVMGNHS
jgi:hypothetical protein